MKLSVPGAAVLAGLLMVAGVSRAAAKIVPSTLDLDVGESAQARLHDGTTATIKVTGVRLHHESVTQMIAKVVVAVEVNGARAELVSGGYRLPQLVGGVQVDAPAVGAFMKDSNYDWWQLKKAARIRVWPAGSPWIEPGTFGYPVRQRWFATRTWFSNEPVSRRPKPGGLVYYHAGMDIGATDGLTEVIAATDGSILTLGDVSATPKPHPAAQPRYDVIYIQDERRWVYRYSHLSAFDPALQAGGRVRKGQRLGYVGKEGGSGGWSHLHFHVESQLPSGAWGVEDSYAFLWQAYREQYDPPVLAVARPHLMALVGETVTLDATQSWAKRGIRSFEWTLLEGGKATGPTVKRTYERPGTYSEVVKVTDHAGNADYDFATVKVFTGAAADGTASVVRVHATYSPTFGIKPGDPVVFRSRAFATGPGVDVHDFGDGTKKIPVPSNIDNAQHAANGYGMVVHHYQKPGQYIVRVERRDEPTGATAVQHLLVTVEPPAAQRQELTVRSR